MELAAPPVEEQEIQRGKNPTPVKQFLRNLLRNLTGRAGQANECQNPNMKTKLFITKIGKCEDTKEEFSHRHTPVK